MFPQFATEKNPEIKFYSLPTEFTITFLVWYDHPSSNAEKPNNWWEKKKKRTQMKKLKIKKSGGERESLPEGSVAIELNI